MIDQELLISVVREQRLLWDKRHKNYRNRVLTKKAWKHVAETIGCTSDEAQSKWKNLRDSFSRELKKLLKQRAGADVEDVKYSGDWLYFEPLKFLEGVIRHRKSKNKAKIRKMSIEEEDTVDEESIVSVLSNSTEISSNTDNQALRQSEFESFPTRLTTDSQCESKPSTSILTDGHLLSPDISQNEYLPTPRIIESQSVNQYDFAKLFADLERQKIDLLKKEIDLQEDEDMNWFKSILPHLKTLPSFNKLMFRTKVQELLLNELTKLNYLQPIPSVVSNSTKHDSL